MEEALTKELETTEKNRDTFVKDFSVTDYDQIVTGWQVRSLSRKDNCFSRSSVQELLKKGFPTSLTRAVSKPGADAKTILQEKLNRLNEQKWGLFRAVKQPVEE